MLKEYVRCQLCGLRLRKEELVKHQWQKHGVSEDDTEEYDQYLEDNSPLT